MSNLNTERFDVDLFTAKIIELDYMEMRIVIEKELESLSHIRMPKDNDKFAVQFYLDFLIRLRSALEGVGKRGNHEWERLQIRPIIQKLVEKGQLLPSALELVE